MHPVSQYVRLQVQNLPQPFPAATSGQRAPNCRPKIKVPTSHENGTRMRHAQRRTTPPRWMSSVACIGRSFTFCTHRTTLRREFLRRRCARTTPQPEVCHHSDFRVRSHPSRRAIETTTATIWLGRVGDRDRRVQAVVFRAVAPADATKCTLPTCSGHSDRRTQQLGDVSLIVPGSVPIPSSSSGTRVVRPRLTTARAAVRKTRPFSVTQNLLGSTTRC